VKQFFSAVLLLVVSVMPTYADEYRPAYLELTQTTSDIFDMLWKVPAKGKSQRFMSIYPMMLL